MNVCQQVRRLFAGRNRRDGDGILHPSWLLELPPGDVVTGLWALEFKPEYPSSRRSPVPFRRYFNRNAKTTLIIEPWGYECLGPCPEIARTKAKRLRQYQAELDRRLRGEGDAAIEAGVAAKVLCTAWWNQGPDVWIKLERRKEPWSWEATSFALIEGIHPTPLPPDRERNRDLLRHSVTMLRPLHRRGTFPSSGAIKRHLIRC